MADHCSFKAPFPLVVEHETAAVNLFVYLLCKPYCYFYSV